MVFLKAAISAIFAPPAGSLPAKPQDAAYLKVL